MTSNELALWRRFRDQGDLTARDRLVERHYPLVHHMARGVERRTAADYDELVSAGAIGLLQAIERFEPARGFQFSTYGAQRIRGAMLDEMRQQAQATRATVGIRRRIATARAQVEARLGRRARSTEVATELGVSFDQYRVWERETFQVTVPVPEQLPADSPTDGRDCELPEWLAEALNRLPARLRQVIALSFYEELPGKTIARILGVSDGRVSQLRTEALARLRDATPHRWAS